MNGVVIVGENGTSTYTLDSIMVINDKNDCMEIYIYADILLIRYYI